eukprot:250091_1
MLVCCVCALFCAFCIAERYIRNYKKDLAEQYRMGSSSTIEDPPANPRLNNTVGTNSITESIISRRKDAPQMKPLSRSASAQIIPRNAVLNGYSTSQPNPQAKMTPMTRSKSMATGQLVHHHGRAKTANFNKRQRSQPMNNHRIRPGQQLDSSVTHSRGPYDIEYSGARTEMSDTELTQNSATMRSRANTLPLNRAPQKQFSPRNNNIRQQKWNNNRQTLQDIPSQREATPPNHYLQDMRGDKTMLSDRSLPPIPDALHPAQRRSNPRVSPQMNRSGSHGQLHQMGRRPMHAQNQLFRPVPDASPSPSPQHMSNRNQQQPPAQLRRVVSPARSQFSQQSAASQPMNPQMNRVSSPHSQPRTVNQQRPPLMRVASPAKSQVSQASQISQLSGVQPRTFNPQQPQRAGLSGSQPLHPQMNSMSANNHGQRPNQLHNNGQNQPQMMSVSPPPQQMRADVSPREGKPSHRVVNVMPRNVVTAPANNGAPVAVSPITPSSSDDSGDMTVHVVKFEDHASAGIMGMMMPGMVGGGKEMSYCSEDSGDGT